VSLAFDIFKDKQAFRLGRARADDPGAEVQPVPSRPFTRAGGSGVRFCAISRIPSHTGEGEREIEEDDLTTAFYEKRRDRSRPPDARAVRALAADEAALRRRVQGALSGVRDEPEQEHVRLASRLWETRGLAALRELRTKN